MSVSDTDLAVWLRTRIDECYNDGRRFALVQAGAYQDVLDRLEQVGWWDTTPHVELRFLPTHPLNTREKLSPSWVPVYGLTGVR